MNNYIEDPNYNGTTTTTTIQTQPTSSGWRNWISNNKGLFILGLIILAALIWWLWKKRSHGNKTSVTGTTSTTNPGVTNTRNGVTIAKSRFV